MSVNFVNALNQNPLPKSQNIYQLQEIKCAMRINVAGDQKLPMSINDLDLDQTMKSPIELYCSCTQYSFVVIL